jgi:thiol-disulfide isomerase/thioredoxin
MKKILIFALIIPFITNCQSPKDFTTLSGHLDNAETLTLTVSSKDFSKEITLDKEGNFKDTLNVETGVFIISDGRNRTYLYLSNGYDLKLKLDVADFGNVAFEGKGKESNEYVSTRVQFSKNQLSNTEAYFELERSEFDSRMTELKDYLSLASTANVDTALVSQVAAENERLIDYLDKNYELKHTAAVKYKKGKPSPKFNNLENYKGGTTSLDDLKGKYVYIDVWATWCGPCKQQIPYLKEVEKEYEHKNIAFVSISTDRPNKYEAWKQMIKDREMSGIQLYSGADQSFSVEYKINAIPRFILIDPSGNIVDANAPRPSDPKLKELFNTLSI